MGLTEMLLTRLVEYPALVVPYRRVISEHEMVMQHLAEIDGQKCIQIFVKGLTGATHTVLIPPTATIGQLKAQVYTKTTVLPSQQRLIFAGAQLGDDDVRLCDFQSHNRPSPITLECTIHLCLRLRGGMYHASSGHSGLYKTFPVNISIPDAANSVIAIDVNGGTTVSHLIELIHSVLREQNKSIPSSHLLIDAIPLACRDPINDTLDSLGLSIEKCPVTPQFALRPLG